MFEAMDKTGMPEHRKYCAPLQALFWLIQDEKMCASGMLLGLNINKRIDEKGNCRPHLLSNMESTNEQNDSTGHKQDYTLEKILNVAWNDESLLIQRSNILVLTRFFILSRIISKIVRCFTVIKRG
jgi:hypothetical protein